MTTKQAQSDTRHAHIALEKKVQECRELRTMAKRAEDLEAAIRRHHALVTKKNDWSADDVLWSVVGLRWNRKREAAS